MKSIKNIFLVALSITVILMMSFQISAKNIQNFPIKSTIYVDDDATYPGQGTLDFPYAKIRFAIENSSDNDDIKIASGEYNENILIDKELSLDWHGSDIIGTDTGKPIINGNGIGIVVLIRASDVVIKQCIITNSGTTDLDAGIYIGEESFNVKILDDEITNCFCGIWVNRITPKETNHEIRGNIIDEIFQQGMLISFSDSNSIYNNVISNCGWHGIHIRDCNENRIRENNITNSEFGLIIDVGQQNEVELNTCENNVRWGFIVINTQKTVITNNNFVNNGEGQATWINCRANQWFQNYWGQTKFIFHIVGGTLRGADISIPWFKIELSPSPTRIVP